jgi:endo-beta-N-acetylglucosaminidase D
MFNLSGDYGNAFIENAPYTNKFAQYHFNFWQYTDYFSPWHGTATAYTPPEYYDELAQRDWQQKWFEFGCLNIPNPTYTDAAHKNGVLSLACIFFSNNDRGQQTYKQMLVKDTDGKYVVAEKLVEMAEYYGYDGYFFNQEETGPDVAPADIPDYIAFLKEFQKAGLYVQWYDAVNTSSGANTFARQINDSNISWLYDRTTKEPVTNSFFFDYGVGSSQINSTNSYLSTLNSAYGTSYNIFDAGFAGLEAGRDRFKSAQGSAISSKLDANGVPRSSIAILGTDFVHAGLDEDMGLSWPVSHRTENDYQWMTTVRDRLWWSGPNQDPRNTAKAAANGAGDVYADNRYWPGIASVISERSVIGNTNFYTNFNTGHGLSYYVIGQVSNNDEWSNMSLQDIPVTWQWWQDTTGNRLEVDYDYGPEYTMTGNTNNRFAYHKIGGYNGGSSLVVDGSLSAEDFLRLYKTELNVNAGSKLSIAYNKPSDNDASSMSVGLIFKDDPTNVVKMPVANTGNKTSGWATAELDLSAYAGKAIAVLGLVFDNGGSTINNYQMNIGQIRVYDGSAVKPAAPTGLKITNAFTNTNEMNLQWNMDTDYSKVKQYNIYVNNTYAGGKYDGIFYIKKLPDRSGTIKVAAVGADGLEGDAASISFDLDKAVSGINVDSKEDGNFTVSWTNPADSAAAGEVTVNIRSVNLPADKIISKKITVPAGSTSASFTGMPVNGDDYILDIAVGSNNAVSLSGNFIDRICEPYAENWSWNGTTLNLPMPNTRDWRYMYVYEDGVPKQFATTYSQGNKSMIIRGRSTKACLSFTSTAQTVSVVMEDYAGNKSSKLYVKTTPLTGENIPDSVLLQWITEHIGADIGSVTDYTGALDLSNLEITDLTGLDLFKNANGLNISNTKIKLLDQNMIPSNATSVNVSNCKELLYICEGAFEGRNSLKTLDITGSSKLKLLSLKGSTVVNLIYGDKTAFPDLISMDLSGTPLNVKTGTPVRIFADYIKTQVVEGQNVTFEKPGIISTVNNGSPVITGQSFTNPAKLFDGITNDTSYGYCGSGGGSVTADFQKNVVMNGFNLYSRTGYITKNFEVYYSEDGVAFTKIGDTVSNNGAQNYKTAFASPVTGRYFKLQVLGSTGTSYITEAQVLGTVSITYPGGVIYKGSDGLTAVSFTPENGINDVGLYDPLRIIFADKVTAGTGNITIYNSDDDSVFQTIPAASEQVSFYQDTATIKHSKLELGKTYYVLIDSKAFEDLSGVFYAGITDKTAWGFTATNIPDKEPPGEVSRQSVSARDRQLTITWTDPTDSDFDHVVVTGAAISVQNVAKGAQKAVISGLDNGRNYDILLKTVDMDGNESEGVTISGTPTAAPDITAPGEVESASVSAGDGQLTITWTDPADADFDYVAVTGPAITSQTVTKGVQQVVISGLENGRTYDIMLRTVDTAGNASTGVTVSGMPVEADTTAPAEVAGAAVTAGNGYLTITWTDPADADFDHVVVTGDGITSQNITRGIQTAVITGLTNGVNYSITLKTADKTGNESAGVGLNGTPAAPAGPSGPSGSSGSSGSSASSVSAPVTEKVKVVGSSIVIVEKPRLDSVTGIAQTAAVTREFIEKAINNAKEDSRGVRSLKLEVPKVEGAAGYSAKIDASLLMLAGKNVNLEIATDCGSIYASSDMLSNLGVNAQSVEIIIKASDVKELDGKKKEQIGSRPVIELSVKIDGKPVKWENLNSPVAVSIPYKPTAEELQNLEHIVVWYINDAGEITSVPNGRYDAATGTVTFTTTHFSKYAVAFVTKTFSDVQQNFWGRNAIEVMASKGIVEGTSENMFSPDKKATRGEFIMWLVKTLGLNAEIDSSFSDVKDTDVYYMEIGIAKMLGITSGVGDNRFNPESVITRQDMMVLTAKAIKAAGINMKLGTADDLSSFADKSNVSRYAVQDVAAMVKSELVVGSNGKLNPKSNITRAEVAQILYKIFNLRTVK